MNNTKTYEELILENERLNSRLREQDALLGTISDTNNEIVIFRLDLDLNFIYIGASAQRVFNELGYPILGSNITDLAFTTTPLFDIVEVFSKCKKNGNNRIELKVVFQMEEFFLSLNILNYYSLNGKHQAYVMVGHMINQELVKRNEIIKLSTAVEQSHNIIVITDKDGFVEYVNKRFTEVTSYSSDEVIGKHTRILKSGNQNNAFYKDLWETILRGDIWKGSFENVDKYGNIIWENAIITPVLGLFNEITHFIAIKEVITEKIRDKMALEDSEIKYRKLFDNANEAIFILDTDFHFIDNNKKAENLFGYLKEELSKLAFFEISPKRQSSGEESEIVSFEYLSNAKKGNSQLFDWIFRKKDGDLFFAEVALESYLSDGKDYIYAFVRDLSAEIKYKARLEQSEERYRRFSNLTIEGIIIHNNGKVLDLNEAITRILGYTELDTKITESFFSIVPEKYFPLLHEKMSQEISDIYEIEVYHKRGELVPVEIRSKEIVFEGKPARVSIIRDVSLRKKIEQDLVAEKEKAQHREEIFQTFFNSIPDVVNYKDASGKWLLANQATMDMYQIKESDYLGKLDSEIAEVSHPEYKEGILKWKESDEKAWNEKTVLQSIEELHTVDGKVLYHDLIKIPLFHDNGERKGIAIIGRDVTKLRQAQEELKVAKKNAEESNALKTKFLHNMSHEIRTPMNGILGFASILKENPNTPKEKREQYLNIIHNSSTQLLRIIDDILEISYIETNRVVAKKEEVCVNTLLLELFSIFELDAKDRNIPLYFQTMYSDEETRIFTDKARLLKILSNLIENAIKFTTKGFIEIGLKIEVDNMIISIKDTGIGIHKDKQDSIFDRFSQEDKEISKNVGGLGLGLSIAKENAEILGGTLTLQSTKNKGSVFFLSIPYNLVNEVKIREEVRGESVPSGFEIILAEDENVNFLFFNIIVNKMKEDIKLLHAKNGEQAIQLAKDHPDAKIILMDIKMPIKDGYEATEEIRMFNKTVPIVALTAFSTPDEKERAMAVGCTDFQSKPITAKILTDIIYKYVK